MRRLAGSIVLSILLSSAAYAAEKQVNICADFGLFPADTPFNDTFTLAAFDFTNTEQADWSIYDRGGGERGLQFGPLGGTITLPAEVANVKVRAGYYVDPAIKVVATEKSGHTVTAKPLSTGLKGLSIDADSGDKIVSLQIMDGDGQGLLAKICVVLSVVQ